MAARLVPSQTLARPPPVHIQGLFSSSSIRCHDSAGMQISPPSHFYDVLMVAGIDHGLKSLPQLLVSPKMHQSNLQPHAGAHSQDCAGCMLIQMESIGVHST